jgi:hypothetical protein
MDGVVVVRLVVAIDVCDYNAVLSYLFQNKHEEKK